VLWVSSLGRPFGEDIEAVDISREVLRQFAAVVLSPRLGGDYRARCQRLVGSDDRLDAELADDAAGIARGRGCGSPPVFDIGELGAAAAPSTG